LSLHISTFEDLMDIFAFSFDRKKSPKQMQLQVLL
jgi:hypothetical protein